MIDRLISDYVALHEIYGNISEEQHDRLKKELKALMQTEAYMYLKYEQLRRTVGRMRLDMSDSTKVMEAAAYQAEALTAKPQEPVQPQKSHWRG